MAGPQREVTNPRLGSRTDPSLQKLAKEEVAAEKARAAAREGTHWLRDEMGRLYEGYAKQSKYVKWKSWIVGGYAVIAIISLIAAAPQMNNIKAYVVPGYDVASREFMVQVKNESSDTWTGVRLVLDDKWEFERDRLPPGEFVQPMIRQFTQIGNKAVKAPVEARPTKLVVTTDQGRFKQTVGGDD